MPKPKEFSIMTKDRLMTYTFVALIVLAAISYLSFGLDSLIVALITVGVAVAVDLLLHKVAADSPLNIMSAAVFGLIVALSYTLGLPAMGAGATYPLVATMQGTGIYLFPALISLIGMVLFKKLQKRKRVNPAAAAKLLVLVFMLSVALLPAEHTSMFPSLTSSLALNPADPGDIMAAPAFGLALQQCFGNDYSAYTPDFSAFNTIGMNDVLYTMLVLKYHGWAGGISSIAVIAIGLALFAICGKYIKWRITVAYLATVALFALALSFVYADGDPILRMVFHLFAGSSIFMAFFMATDPASTPLTYKGQLIFGAGVGLLTVIMQTYLNFFGGSILALVIMNLTCPYLDRVGIKKTIEPVGPKVEVSLPTAKLFTNFKTYECIRSDHYLLARCYRLSTILIKEAFEKQKVETLIKLNADYCDGCGQCSFVCPSRIDLRSSVLKAKAMLRPEPTPEPKPQTAVAKAKKTMDSGVDIIKIEGIGPVYAEKLKSIKITTTTDLLEAGATPSGRKELAEKTGVSDKLILEWVNIADLFRIEGVGEEYSDLLEESGVDTVVELSRRVPENLHSKMLEVNKEKKIVRKPPTLNEVKQWVNKAKKLPRKIEY